MLLNAWQAMLKTLSASSRPLATGTAQAAAALQQVLHCRAETAQGMIADADADGSGTLDTQEWRSVLKNLIARSPVCQYRGLEWGPIESLFQIHVGEVEAAQQQVEHGAETVFDRILRREVDLDLDPDPCPDGTPFRSRRRSCTKTNDALPSGTPPPRPLSVYLYSWHAGH